MTAQSEEKPESVDLLTSYKTELGELKAREKGYLGQIKRMKNQLSKKGGNVSAPNEESSGNSADSSAESTIQAPIPHLARPYEKVCVDCGGENPNFKGKPNVFCNGPECKGRIPMGYQDPARVTEKDGHLDMPDVGKCFNCGKDDSAVMVTE